MESNPNNLGKKGKLIPILLGTSLVLNIVLTSMHLYSTYKLQKRMTTDGAKKCGCKKKG